MNSHSLALQYGILKRDQFNQLILEIYGFHKLLKCCLLGLIFKLTGTTLVYHYLFFLKILDYDFGFNL